MKFAYNVTSRRVHETIFALEKQLVLHTLSVQNSMSMRRVIIICGLSGCTIFFHNLKKGTIFEKHLKKGFKH
jgi:hypothetical protein